MLRARNLNFSNLTGSSVTSGWFSLFIGLAGHSAYVNNDSLVLISCVTHNMPQRMRKKVQLDNFFLGGGGGIH